MDMRLSLRLALVAAAFSVVAALPAAAADDDCKASVRAEGKPATLRDLGAYPNSLLAWRSAVREKYGAEYNSWRYSKDCKVDCTEGGGQWTCVRTARPCKDLLSRALGGAKEAVAPKRECVSEALSSYGAAKKDKKTALEEASVSWEIDVRKKHGKDYAVWKNAAETDIDCHDVKGGIQCIAVGTACRS